MPTPTSSPRDCCSMPVTRRQFLKSSAVAVAAGSVLPALTLGAKEKASRPSETLVTQFYQALSPEQRTAVCFPFDHPLRNKVDNNWNITDKKIGQFFSSDQQAMIREIFLKLHSEEYAQTVMKQVEHDSGKDGFGGSAIALFGQPGSGKFEFVLTGRHCTRRCDGDSVDGAAFGGPIFYGHAAKGFYEKADHPDNVYWFQAIQANRVFQTLSGKQREVALLGESREENGTETVRLTGKKSGLPGIPLSELSRDQKEEVRKAMETLLAPFRKQDSEEALKLVEAGGFDNLHMAFYKNHDIGKDGVWDVWQIEGPSTLWFFRGDPHVHAWVHIRRPA